MTGEGKPRLLLESAFLGVIGALGAQLFLWMLRVCNNLLLKGLSGYSPPGIETSLSPEVIGPHGLWLIPAVTTLGGLISGFLVYRFAPEAEGHGTDTAVNAFHRKEGLIRPRVPAVKMLASAITIGSGGSAGREGPIALIAAGLGSVYARLAHRTEEERRLLLLAGMAAGLSAIFRSPMGTAVFAIEVLYGTMEFESGALLYTMLSSAVAYTLNGVFVGFQPLFSVPKIPTPVASDYAAYAILGVAAALVGTALPEVFYKVRDLFRLLPVPLWTKPAIGGLGLGLLALRFPQVLGGGYGWIQYAMNGEIVLRLALLLIFAKMIAFALTVSSGGSGGVFAPSLFVGAMLGASLAIVLHQLPVVFVIAGMAAVFGAAARVPIATMLMVTEMAGGYHLLVPAGLAVMISYLLQRKLSQRLRYRSLYEGQVPGRSDSPAHYLEHIQVALSLLGKRDIMLTDKLGHLDLVRLLQSRIRFDLPGGRELSMGVVKEGSPLAGRSIHVLYRQLAQHDFEVIAVMRREHVVLAHPETRLEPNDRVILITSAGAREDMGEWIAPIPTGSGERNAGSSPGACLTNGICSGRCQVMQKPNPSDLPRVPFVRILFTTDFSPTSARALPYAAAMARHFNSELYVSHVIPLESYGHIPPEERDAVLAALRRKTADQIAKLLALDDFRRVYHRVLIDHGEFLPVLSAQVKEHDVDLIVAGAHGRHGLEKLISGSVAEEIFELARQPVLLIGPEVTIPPQAEVGLRRILFVTDFSLVSRRAMEYAYALAKAYGAQLYFLHVVEDVWSEARSTRMPAEPFCRLQLQNRDWPQPEEGLQTEFLVEFGSAETLALEEARKLDVQLIVVSAAATSHPGLISHLPGPLAYNIMTHAPCPVLAIHGALEKKDAESVDTPTAA